MVDITIVTGVYKPTYNWGAPSCRCWSIFSPKTNPLDPSQKRMDSGDVAMGNKKKVSPERRGGWHCPKIGYS